MDYSFEDYSKYRQYLNTIDIALNGYFEEQKDYIFCKKGCGHCCEKGQYPYSELEAKFLLLGFFKIPIQEQQKIIQNIIKTKEEYAKAEDKKSFSYACPFLNEEKVCTVYDFRGLICRTFGLLTISPSGKCNIPFCYSLGLNYSNVYDEKNKRIDYDKVKSLGFEKFPNARKTNIKTLMSPEMFEGEPLNFGEIKSLVEWL